ncbi:hypothetical protein PG996_016089 [Apiospora saccharicola]|uniref:Uncharacterized protein n=1 Tax=Apiospora saccharicola TaxID=335842 RepID=A0ABR1TMY1_9PEZI
MHHRSPRNLPHPSDNDSDPHVTVWCQSQAQVRDGVRQVAHIYMDLNFARTGHILFDNERQSNEVHTLGEFPTVQSTAVARKAR